eukprot:5090631-Pleurochrysis_carterae.AAC.1
MELTGVTTVRAGRESTYYYICTIIKKYWQWKKPQLGRLRAISGRGRRGRRRLRARGRRKNPERRGRARARYTCDASAYRQMCMQNDTKGRATAFA